MTQDEEIKEHLASSNPDFRSLVEQHHSLEAQLREMTGQAHITDQQQLDRVTLKKRKLNLKDQMNRMIQQYRQEQAEPQHS